MSRLLSCSAIAERALREIGAFSTYDASADPAQLEVALEYLDLLIAEIAGLENLWCLQPARQTILIPAATRTFSLSGLLTTNIQFFSSVRLIRPEAPSEEIEVEMIRRSAYDSIESKDDTGDPEVIYIERNDKPNASIWRTASRTGLSLVIDGQRYAGTATDNQGKNLTDFPAAWQRFLIKRLAVDIGSGPVAIIPTDERQQKSAEAEKALALLLSRNDREQIKRPRMVQAWDPVSSACAPYRPRRRRDYGQ